MRDSFEVLNDSAISGSWNDLQNITQRADGDANTQLTEAEVDAFVDNNGYVRNVDLAAIATSGSWNDLLGIPADIADGDANTGRPRPKSMLLSK